MEHLIEGLAQSIRLSLTPAFFYQLLVVLNLMVVAMLCLYGSHRLMLLAGYSRKGRYSPEPADRYSAEQLPGVTVQLPMFNEGTVAERIIDAACKIKYPLDRLQIQVLDDSTDHTKQLCKQRVAYWRDQGIDIEMIHRVDRTGYKAGAMEDAEPRVKHDFIAIFDADFVPEPSFLLQAIHHFNDPNVALVQTRWEHLNREHNILTRVQAMFLDGHFLLEHTARNQTGRFVHFNGTGGIWRKQPMIEAGGWSARTLSEDFDLSTRVQLNGHKLVIDTTIDCPAELPPEIGAYKTQQHRWAKGTTQCLLKLYPKILFSKQSWKVKTEAFFQFTWPMAAIPITLSAILPLPTMLLSPKGLPWPELAFHSVLGPIIFLLGSLSGLGFFAYGQRVAGRSFFRALAQSPLLMAVGYGIALTNTRGVIEALLGHESAFVRTPKYNDATVAQDLMDEADTPAPGSSSKLAGYLAWDHKRVMPFVELGMGFYMAITLAVATMVGAWFFVPIPALLMIGYTSFGIASLNRLRVPKLAPAIQVVDPMQPRPLPTFRKQMQDEPVGA